eukprot:31251-Pelagococcus_subviridis.AAC.4
MRFAAASTAHFNSPPLGFGAPARSASAASSAAAASGPRSNRALCFFNTSTNASRHSNAFFRTSLSGSAHSGATDGTTRPAHSPGS